MPKKGIIYILTNEAMPGYVKIGKINKSNKSTTARMKELDSTGVPLPFECYFAGKVSDVDYVEKKLHDAFDDHRLRPRREFFEISPKRVLSALQLVVEFEDVTPRDEVFENPDEDRAAIIRATNRRSRLNLEKIGIKPGAILVHSRNEKATCKVIDNRRVEFHGETMSLSKSGLLVFNELGFNWSAVSGSSCWEYEGETLDERRQRLESETSD